MRIPNKTLSERQRSLYQSYYDFHLSRKNQFLPIQLVENTSSDLTQCLSIQPNEITIFNFY